MGKLQPPGSGHHNVLDAGRALFVPTDNISILCLVSRVSSEKFLRKIHMIEWLLLPKMGLHDNKLLSQRRLLVAEMMSLLRSGEAYPQFLLVFAGKPIWRHLPISLPESLTLGAPRGAG